MSYKANFIAKLIKKLKKVQKPEIKRSVFADHVGKWLAGEGRNFITMATL